MNRPEIRIYTDAENFIDREMNDEEFEQWQKDKAASEARLAAEAEAKAKREALLTRLGITEEEASLLAHSL